MKIEFLPGKPQRLPLIRLFEFKSAEVQALMAACDDLAEGRISHFALHEQPWVNPIGGCQFWWISSTHDVGVMQPAAGEPLVLEYSDEAWREVRDKLAQFVNPSRNGFNWLTMEGDVDVLISFDCTW